MLPSERGDMVIVEAASERGGRLICILNARRRHRLREIWEGLSALSQLNVLLLGSVDARLYGQLLDSTCVVALVLTLGGNGELRVATSHLHLLAEVEAWVDGLGEGTRTVEQRVVEHGRAGCRRLPHRGLDLGDALDGLDALLVLLVVLVQLVHGGDPSGRVDNSRHDAEVLARQLALLSGGQAGRVRLDHALRLALGHGEPIVAREVALAVQLGQHAGPAVGQLHSATVLH